MHCSGIDVTASMSQTGSAKGMLSVPPATMQSAIPILIFAVAIEIVSNPLAQYLFTVMNALVEKTAQAYEERMALTNMFFIRSSRNFCFSVLLQIRGMISLIPISVAFSRNHSKRAAVFRSEMAIDILRES